MNKEFEKWWASQGYLWSPHKEWAEKGWNAAIESMNPEKQFGCFYEINPNCKPWVCILDQRSECDFIPGMVDRTKCEYWREVK